MMPSIPFDGRDGGGGGHTVRTEPCCELSANRRIELISNLPTPQPLFPPALLHMAKTGRRKRQ